MTISRQPRERRRPPRALVLLAALLAASLCLGAASAAAAKQVLRFRGETVRAPSSWPVYRLAEHPGMCVRLDRRAVYLGSPAANQRCPVAAAVGRRRAILVDPAARSARSSALPVIPRALASAGGNVFTGLGFDACSAPSSKAMAAWAASPYRAIGVYIGGENRGCSQPNLTASWVSAQTDAGWHLIPTYVGLQAPTSSCSSCAKLSASLASAQGAEAAADAVADASAVAIGPGSPIYFDMESYTRTSSASAATLAFLEAWTQKLHSLGYVSGVYSSSASGIADLAAKLGSSYVQPDDLWIANWNGQQSTADSVVPASAWSDHQRIHQYRGGHDESYGGTTINIDNNYVDADTVGSATLATSNYDPIGHLDLIGAPAPGQVRVKGWAFDPELPTEAATIVALVGGRAGSPNAVEYNLGPVATRSRADVGALYPEAGSRHGFDVRIPTVKSRAQPVCVYAINTGLGGNRLLGCKAITIPVAITLSRVRATAAGVQVRIACEWPVGTACPGQLALRTRIKVALPHRRGRPPRIRAVTRSLGRRPFQLSGGSSHAFVVPLSAGGRALLRQRGQLQTQLIAAIPGGKRVAILGIRR
ncbi:MAG: glycoside hydrolase domain-containing protein [Solirubrobacterales bacterium]